MIDNNDGTYSATYAASTTGTIKVNVYKRESSGLFANFYPLYSFTGTPVTFVTPTINYNWGTGYVIGSCY